AACAGRTGASCTTIRYAGWRSATCPRRVRRPTPSIAPPWSSSILQGGQWLSAADRARAEEKKDSVRSTVASIREADLARAEAQREVVCSTVARVRAARRGKPTRPGNAAPDVYDLTVPALAGVA